MRFVRLTLFSLIILFLVVTAISLLFPSSVIVSRAVNINAPKDSVFIYIKDMRGWKLWIEGMDKPAVKILSDTESDMAGTKVVIDPAAYPVIKSLWQNARGKYMIATINLFEYPAHKNTTVQWQYEQHVKWYPWEKFGSMMNDKILGPMMETDLNNLKKLIEKN